MSKKTEEQIKSTKINDKVESIPKILADSFNDFFVTGAENIDKNIIHASAKGFPGNSVTKSFFLKLINEEEVNSIIKQMKTKKAIGPSSIPTKILKFSQQIIAKPPVYLINLFFSTGVFPDLLKIANIIPAFKKGDSQDYNNYRPISLTSNLGKLIKKLVHKRLYNFLEKHSLLFEKQYSFYAKILLSSM